MRTLIIRALGVIGALGHLNNLPAFVRFSTHKKISEICEICVSHKNTTKAGIRVKKKAPRMGGYHFLRSLSLKKTIAISYDFFVLMMNTKAAAITR